MYLHYNLLTFNSVSYKMCINIQVLHCACVFVKRKSLNLASESVLWNSALKKLLLKILK